MSTPNLSVAIQNWKIDRLPMRLFAAAVAGWPGWLSRRDII
jgi:hypothetical protein